MDPISIYAARRSKPSFARTGRWASDLHRLGLNTVDALHLATAQFAGCEALWTNDDRFVNASDGRAVNVLRAS